jgi:hypothetical protein
MSDDAQPLVLYETGNYQQRYGGRVFPDGRYELYDQIDTDGKPLWTAYESFTPDHVTLIAAAVDKVLAAHLPADITGETPPVPDSSVGRFTLKGQEFTIVGYPNNTPPEIKQLVDLILKLHQPAS